MGTRLSREEFIIRAIKIYSDTYDYSKVIYINNCTKIEIICRKHGSFLQEPRVHLSGHECLKCKNEKQILSQDEFISRAKSIHGDKYDYSPSIYKNMRSKLEIICHQHGVFLQEPNDHLKGRGCPICAIEKQTKSLELFIEQANNLHNNKYDYSAVEYKNNTTKINIKCFIHGNFLQRPVDHLRGQGCPKCGIASQAKTRSGTLQNFIEKATKKHDGKYDYSNVHYVNNHTKVEIICPLHGIFIQSPGQHLIGNGCSKCSSNVSNMETKWLDSLGIPRDCRQKYLKINGKKIMADAYDPTTNTVYEFYGDFWHGNPEIYDQNDINVANKKTFGKLYQETLDKENLIKSAGYNLVFMWEDNFINGLADG